MCNTSLEVEIPNIMKYSNSTLTVVASSQKLLKLLQWISKQLY
jgi:hypothetical protein